MLTQRQLIISCLVSLENETVLGRTASGYCAEVVEFIASVSLGMRGLIGFANSVVVFHVCVLS
jgi:hypothetical protein